MAICRLTDSENQSQYALYQAGKICPLSNLTDHVPRGAELFDRGIDWLAALPEPSDEQWQPAPERLLPPIPTPEKVICIGLNYRDHARETGSEIPSQPVVFNKFPTAVIGHGDSIQLPRVSEKVDYEAELVIVIGRTAKHVPASSAMDHVFGYTCGHDVSARDWQKGTPAGQWLLGKTFDTFAPMGPCLVTRKELSDPGNLRVRMHLNGEVVQDSTTAQLIFDIPTLIAYLTQITTLNPGDVIFTGTPPGVGMARNPRVFLQPGDTCSVEIDGIGMLTNRCVAEQPA
jgi:2-keto-4-pentenoate hydratase/2-oxohepta-3-ene-1,7-dioic acid hydratase in catechol pathway